MRDHDWIIGQLDELVSNYDSKQHINLTDSEIRTLNMICSSILLKNIMNAHMIKWKILEFIKSKAK